jgi:gamma-glutamylcyclotransferase (GGCT)/AIG2-like uncharacterized protein YtfP
LGAEPNDDVVRLFVYGGLMRGFDLHHYLAGCTFEGEGSAPGVLYRAGRYPALVNGNGRVQGEVYRLRDPAADLESLDELEEYDPTHPESSLYVRRTCEVRLHDGSMIRAWVYAYQRDVSALERIENGDWRATSSASRPAPGDL